MAGSWCSRTGTFHISGKVYIYFSDTVEPTGFAEGISLTLVKKVCSGPAITPCPNNPGSTPPNTYCKVADLEFEQTVTDCSGNYSFTVENAIACAIYAAPVVRNPDWTLTNDAAEKKYAILEPLRQIDMMGAIRTRVDQTFLHITSNIFAAGSWMTPASAILIDGLSNTGDFLGSPCSAGGHLPGARNYGEDASSAFYNGSPTQTGRMVGPYWETFPSLTEVPDTGGGSHLEANLLDGEVVCDLQVPINNVVKTYLTVEDTSHHVWFAEVKGIGITLTDDCDNTETQTNGDQYQPHRKINFRGLTAVSTTGTADCDNVVWRDGPGAGEIQIYPTLTDTANDYFWTMGAGVNPVKHPPYYAIIDDCGLPEEGGLGSAVLAHRVGHFFAGSGHLARAWHPDMPVDFAHTYDSGGTGETCLAMEPQFGRLSITYVKDDPDNPGTLALFRQTTEDWGETYLPDPEDGTPLLPLPAAARRALLEEDDPVPPELPNGVTHFRELYNPRTQEWVTLINDARELGEDDLPTGRGRLLSLIYDSDRKFVGTYPADADGMDGIGEILADDDSFGAETWTDPVQYLEVTFNSDGDRLTYRSYDDGRTWADATEAPVTARDAGSVRHPFVVYNRRTSERLVFYNDGSVMAGGVPTGEGLLLVDIYAPDGTFVGTFPEAEGGITGDVIDDVAFGAEYTENPVTMVEITLPGSHFRSYDNARTWEEFGSDTPPTRVIRRRGRRTAVSDP